MERMLDGVGGTIKRLATHASLQHPFSKQVLTRKQLFGFPDTNVDGINLFFVSSEEVVSNTEFLKSRFATSSTFKVTQSHHRFIPNASSLSLTVKKTLFATYSKEVSLVEGGSSKVQMTIEDINPGRFYACQYHNDWYFCVGNMCQVSMVI